MIFWKELDWMKINFKASTPNDFCLVPFTSSSSIFQDCPVPLLIKRTYAQIYEYFVRRNI